MKTFIYSSLFLIFVLGCGVESPLKFETHQMQWEICKTCPKVELNIPKALNATDAARNFNGTLEREVIGLLPFGDIGEAISEGEDEDEVTPEDGNENETDASETINKRAEWEAQIDGAITYNSGNILTVMLKSYTYTGGTHGYNTTTYLNFENRRAQELENGELFTDIKGFQDFVEAQFRSQNSMPPFEADTFRLPDNIGYTEEGLRLFYNLYELAAHAEGPIALTIPYALVNPYLIRKVAL